MNPLRFLLPGIALTLASISWAAEPAKPTAAATKPDTNACTWVASIDDWRELDDRHLIVWASRNDYYHVELSAPLVDLGSAESISFKDHNHDGRICGFGMDAIEVPRSVVFGSSTIIGMTRLDEAGLEQLAAQYKIKLRAPKNKDKDAAENKPVAAPATAETNGK